MATDISPSTPLEAPPAFADILRRDEHFAAGGDEDVADRVNGWFDQLLLQSGWQIAPSLLLQLVFCSGIVCGGLAFVIQENLLTATVGATAGFLLPIAVAVIARGRRLKQMLDQTPGMVEELARAAKTGRSLDQCFELVAEDTPSPLGGELRLCARKTQMGINLADALRELPGRTGLVSLNVLVTALTVHQQTGGDLVSVLERLSRTIRDRILFVGRLRAATTASRATAILMLILPPLILAFFLFRDPDYITNLTSSSWGRGVTLTAIVLQIVGSVWIMRILKITQRG